MEHENGLLGHWRVRGSSLAVSWPLCAFVPLVLHRVSFDTAAISHVRASDRAPYCRA